MLSSQQYFSCMAHADRSTSTPKGLSQCTKMKVTTLTTALCQEANDLGEEDDDDVMEFLPTLNGVCDCSHVEVVWIVDGKPGLQCLWCDQCFTPLHATRAFAHLVIRKGCGIQTCKFHIPVNFRVGYEELHSKINQLVWYQKALQCIEQMEGTPSLLNWKGVSVHFPSNAFISTSATLSVGSGGVIASQFWAEVNSSILPKPGGHSQMQQFSPWVCHCSLFPFWEHPRQGSWVAKVCSTYQSCPSCWRWLVFPRQMKVGGAIVGLELGNNVYCQQVCASQRGTGIWIVFSQQLWQSRECHCWTYLQCVVTHHLWWF